MVMSLTELRNWLWESTIYGSVAIGLVFLLAPLIRKYLGAQAAYALWGLVLMRLLAPWTFVWPENAVSRPLINLSQLAGEWTGVQADIVVEDVVARAGRAATSPLVTHSLDWGLMIWGLGALGMGVFLVIRATSAFQLVSRAREVPDRARLQESMVGFIPNVHKIKICETSEIFTPALCGLFSPVILLPVGWAEKWSLEDLRCVLSHEIGHRQRGDILWRWLFQVARVIHWFNPFVWLAERRARVDQEMACDAWVFSRNGAPDLERYGELLLVLTRGFRRTGLALPIQAGMAETKEGLTRRITHLAKLRPSGWRSICFSLTTCLVLWAALSPARGIAEPISQTVFTAKERAIAPTPMPERKAPTQVEMESFLVQMDGDTASKVFQGKQQPIYSSEEILKILGRLEGVKGIDLVRLPKVTVKSGQRAMVQIVREFPYPVEFQADKQSGKITPTSFETRNLGLTTEVLPEIMAEGTILCVLTPSIVDLSGVLDYGADYLSGSDLSKVRDASKSRQEIGQPIFESREVSSVVNIRSGQTVMLGGMEAAQGDLLKLTEFRDSHPFVLERSDRLLYIFVTLKALMADGLPADRSLQKATPTMASPGTVQGGMEYGTPVPGKPGFVTSPYAEKAGFVDVRGFPPGAEARCPYSGRMFLIP